MPTLIQSARVIGLLLILQTLVTVAAAYRDYFPPNFRSDFLLGREGHFWGPYRFAFYTHIVSGPLSLALGTMLISERLRRRLPAWHRRLGRVQVACVLLFVAPSGVWMAPYSVTGSFAGWGFASLAIATGVATAAGWRAAVGRRFARHRVWMLRSYTLLCSAVVLRVIGGASDYFDAGWTYPIAAWASWLLPLGALEAARWFRHSPPG